MECQHLSCEITESPVRKSITHNIHGKEYITFVKGCALLFIQMRISHYLYYDFVR